MQRLRRRGRPCRALIRPGMQGCCAVLVLLAMVCPGAAAQSWRTAAEARIEQHRKADLRVVVVDARGQPVEGATVRVEMQRHAFKFGTAVASAWARAEPRADLSSGDLDLGEKMSAFRVRLDVPQGTEIESAFLQFTADKDAQDQPTPLTIWAVAEDDTPDFDQTGISTRERTAASVSWDVSVWGQRGERAGAQRSPDVGALVQEVVDRAGWQSGQHIAFILVGSGKRSAQTFDQDPDAAARLVFTVAAEEHTAQPAGPADDAEEAAPDFTGTDAQRYRSELVRLFNYAAPGNALKWRPWESDSVLARGTVDWLKAQGIPTRGHVMIWSSWRWNAIPIDVEERQGEPEYVRQRAVDHVQAIAAAYDGHVLEWDVVNEPLHETDLEQIVGFDERIRWYQMAQQATPQARLFVNDFDILEGPALVEPYKQLIRDLIDAGAPVGGIGMQGHFLGQPPTPEQLVERLASMAELGLPLQITEFDMNKNWSAEQQEAFMEEVLVASFAEPAMTAFNMWGFWDGNHWLGSAPLFAHDWTLKPSGAVWEDYVFNRWWTDDEGATGPSGAFDVRGYKGSYALEVSYGGETVNHEVELLEDREEVVALTNVTLSTVPQASHELLQIRGIYPSPFRVSAQLVFTLGTAARVHVDLFDTLGRPAWSHRPGVLSPGEHRVEINAPELAPGLYLARITATWGAARTVRTVPVLHVR